MPRYVFRRRVLRPIVRRFLPGTPVGGGSAVPARELSIPGAGGAPFVVTDGGQGPAILLVHAGSASGSSWSGVAAALSGRFRILRFDRLIYRHDPAPTGADAMAGEVADVLAIASAVEGPLLLVGHSSGAVVALQSALAAPSRFAGMLLYEPPVAVTEPLGGDALRRARAALDAGDPDQAIAIHSRDIVGSPPLTVALMRLIPPVRHAMRRYAAGQIADDEALESLGVGIDRYAALDLPVLLLGGARSPANLRTRLDALASVLPRLDSVVVLAKQGHLATLRAPGKVAAVIASFADRVLR
jgi:pimeloyl-ACP methyl ester carboxylesterase